MSRDFPTLPAQREAEAASLAAGMATMEFSIPRIHQNLSISSLNLILILLLLDNYSTLTSKLLYKLNRKI